MPAVLVDQHRSDTGPDPDATSNFDADRDPDRTLPFTHVEKSSQSTLFCLSRQRSRCYNFQYI